MRLQGQCRFVFVGAAHLGHYESIPSVKRPPRWEETLGMATMATNPKSSSASWEKNPGVFHCEQFIQPRVFHGFPRLVGGQVCEFCCKETAVTK